MAKREAATGESGGVTVFGIGGAGGNAVAALLRNAGSAMTIVCADTDVQALQGVAAGNRLQLGRRLTAGLGAGAGPEIGRAAAEEALPEIEAALAGSALCCIAVGLGGGTGTGAAPVIARAARARGILTIGVVTRPFAHEGKRQARVAATGAATLAAEVDLLVSVCNQQLLEQIGPGASLQAALDRSDTILGARAADFARLLGGPARKRIGLDRLQTLLADSGHAAIGHGEAHGGPERVLTAARAALDDPLLNGAAAKASRLLVIVTGGRDLALREAEAAIGTLRASLGGSTELVWSVAIDPALAGQVRVGIVAPGMPAPRSAPTRGTVHRLPAASASAALRPARRTAAAPQTATGAEMSAPPQLSLALDAAAPRPSNPRVLAIVPRSAVTPSLADRLYRAARTIQRRVQPRRIAPQVASAKPHGAIQLLKPFDPPPRPALNAIGPLAGVARTRVILT